MACLEILGVKVIRKSRQKIYEEKVLEILRHMPETEILALLPDYTQHEWLYRFLADKRDKSAGIPIQGPEALNLFCQRIEELRKCQEEDGEESSEEDPEYRELGQFLNSLSQCRSLLNFLSQCKDSADQPAPMQM